MKADIGETKFYRNPKIDNLSLNLISIGQQRSFGESGAFLGIENSYVIHYIFAGKGWITCREGEVELKEGDLFLTYPKDRRRYRVDSKKPWEYFWIKISGQSAGDLMGKTPFSTEIPYFTSSKDLTPYIYDMIKSKGSELSNRLELIGKLYVFLSKIVVNPNIEVDKYFRIALQYISAHYNKGIKISDIAKHLNISRDYLYKIFMQSSQMSPTDYMITYKINESLQLLSNSNLSIAQIAEATGFYDQFHFSKTFKRIMGKTPVQYRKNFLVDELKG